MDGRRGVTALVVVVSIALAGCSGTHRAPAVASATPAGSTTPTPRPARRPPPAGLVDLDPSIIVRLRYATSDNFTGAPLPGYAANRGLLRPAAAAALLRADRALQRHGLRVIVLDAYRPVRATLAMVAWARRVGRADLIGPYIATRSEHNLGTAVDVTLGAAGGTELDMGVPFDTLDPRAHYANSTGRALVHRRRLRATMIDAGFTPYDAEWWHFSIHVAGVVPLDDVIR